ncbi:hypothetical protein FIBSPDRAFT_105694 [Athelia psychrophila]|uniref:Uncharacterized protein n=1 Tax=Athelia psychrophila TaxID=1759441 RepID=A0A166DBT7_9AGAM|nr:hypothetical protein FIBSPDRAFT_105694 [Fibularhizoctonia sp. CBS 109695]
MSSTTTRLPVRRAHRLPLIRRAVHSLGSGQSSTIYFVSKKRHELATKTLASELSSCAFITAMARYHFCATSMLIVTLVQMRMAARVSSLSRIAWSLSADLTSLLYRATTTSSRTATVSRTAWTPCATSATTPPRPSSSMRRFWRMEHGT